MLTNMEKALIAGLKIFEMQEEEIIAIMIAMDTEQKQNQLLEWMEKNPKATASEVLTEMVRITKI